LITKLPTILASSCFYIQNITPAMGCAGDTVSVIGENLLATDVFLKCRFTFLDGEQVIIKGHHFNNTLMHCVVPDALGTANAAILEVTTDGVGFTDNGFTFQYLTSCDHRDDNMTALGVVPATGGAAVWWPWLFFLLLPLLCCLLLAAWCCRRRKPKQQQRPQPVSTQETTLEEETFQIEGLETNSVPPVSPHKWKVQPAAYIGFGKAKMDVNWNGEAPESAPHSLRRQRVPVNALEGPVEGVPLSPMGQAYAAGDQPPKQRGCCPWSCCPWLCGGEQQSEPQYPCNEGEEQHLAVPRVVFHADSGHVSSNTTLERKNVVEG